MTFSERLRKEAEQLHATVGTLLPGLNRTGAIRMELEALAASLPTDEATAGTRENMLSLIRQLPSNQGELLVSAIVGAVTAKMQWLVADQTEYLIGRDVIESPKSEAVKKRSELNNQIRTAVLKGYADGDWSGLSAITERLASGNAGGEGGAT